MSPGETAVDRNNPMGFGLTRPPRGMRAKLEMFLLKWAPIDVQDVALELFINKALPVADEFIYSHTMLEGSGKKSYPAITGVKEETREGWK
uniref:Uncharacterized protein n=2 Tax=Timema TaxID=61471 RepID=A0A7R9H8G5_TIMPO|nr:unnamed protein product [Timema douglasi]CAD7412609.1 unnamed protein product [Timema poppensis]